MFCHKCGKQAGEDSIFCHKCGTKLKLVVDEPEPQEQTPNMPVGIIEQSSTELKKSGDDELLKMLICKNSNYYLAQFNKIDRGEKSFNWIAFFFAPILLLYRKQFSYFCKLMFPVYILILAEVSIAGYATATFNFNIIWAMPFIYMITGAFTIVMSIICGKGFNKHYKMRLSTAIAEKKLRVDDKKAIKKLKPFALIPVFFIILYCIISFALNYAISFIVANSWFNDYDWSDDVYKWYDDEDTQTANDYVAESAVEEITKIATNEPVIETMIENPTEPTTTGLTGYYTQMYDNGDKYTGNFVNGIRSGQGTYEWADGIVYNGEFANGNPNGNGDYIYPTTEPQSTEQLQKNIEAISITTENDNPHSYTVSEWKGYLKDLLRKLPSLFDYGWLYDFLDNGVIPVDAIILGEKDFVVPFGYNFYDLDNDDVPEIFIWYGVPESEGGWNEIYKLYDNEYESIGSGLLFYTNSQNKLVAVDGFYGISSIRFAEIKNKQFVYSDYIDSSGNTSYQNLKYDSLDMLDGIGIDYYELENIDSTLEPIPKFINCYDVVYEVQCESNVKLQLENPYNFLDITGYEVYSAGTISMSVFVYYLQNNIVNFTELDDMYTIGNITDINSDGINEIIIYKRAVIGAGSYLYPTYAEIYNVNSTGEIINTSDLYREYYIFEFHKEAQFYLECLESYDEERIPISLSKLNALYDVVHKKILPSKLEAQMYKYSEQLFY